MTPQSPENPSNTFAETYSRDIGNLICNPGTRFTEAQTYTYLKDHVQPTAKKNSKTICKGGRAVNLIYQASWMSGSQVYWHVYSPKLNGGLCQVCLLFDTSDDTSKHSTFVKFPFQKLEKAFSSRKKNQGIINFQSSSLPIIYYMLFRRLKISL